MNWNRLSIAVVALSCLLAGANAAAQGQGALTQDALTLERALALAMQHNAELAAASKEKEASEAALDQAGVLPNPELGFTNENLGNARKKAAGDRSTSVQIGQLIELGGKREARVRLAQAARGLAEWEFRSKRAEVLARVKQGFYDVLAVQRRAELAGDSVRLAQEVADAVAKRVQAGRVSPVEETKARLALAQAMVEREQARRELAAARHRLAALWGDPAPRFARAEGDLEQLPDLPGFEALAERVSANPDFARWASEIERRRAGVDAERAKAIPDITVSGGVTRFSEFNDRAYMIGISIPLPVFNQNRGGILEANRRLDKGLLEQRAAQTRLLTELSDVYQRTAAIKSEVEALRGAILPGAQSAFDAATKGYQLGKFGFLDVLDAQRTLFQARTQYLRALTDYQRGSSELERLTGVLR